MLELHQLNGETVWINPDKIKMIFKSPDTTLVFTDDSRMIVRDSIEELKNKWLRFRKAVR